VQAFVHSTVYSAALYYFTMATEQLKLAAVAALRASTTEKVAALEFALAAVVNSRNNETKSTAGDKYETGRAMAQQEQARLQQQLNEAKQQLQQVEAITVHQRKASAAFGSLIATKNNVFLLAFAFGKLSIDGSEVFVLSPSSPLGRQFLGKEAGDYVTFRNTSYHITSLC
jgi:transcription elongation GreA/GreB family factor